MAGTGGVQRDAKIVVTKIEAAKRQLDCAIELWFTDQDPVAIQTLAAAAYQIIFDINEHRGNAHQKLFNADIVKPEYRRMWNAMVRAPSNFLKHADKDPEGSIELIPFANIMFLMFAVAGLGTLSQESSDNERIFAMWLNFHEPDLVADSFKSFAKEHIKSEDSAKLRTLSKVEFFKASKMSFSDLRRRGAAQVTACRRFYRSLVP